MPVAKQKTQNRSERPWRRALAAVRFVVRMQIAAREWQKHEHTRRRLEEKAEEMRRGERMRRMRDEWKKEMKGRVGEVHV